VLARVLPEGRETDSASLSSALAQARREAQRANAPLQRRAASEASLALSSRDTCDLPACSALAHSGNLACAELSSANEALRSANAALESDRLAQSSSSSSRSARLDSSLSFLNRANSLQHAIDCATSLSSSDPRRDELLQDALSSTFPQLTRECLDLIDESSITCWTHEHDSGACNSAVAALEVLGGSPIQECASHMASALVTQHFGVESSQSENMSSSPQAIIDAFYSDAVAVLVNVMNGKPHATNLLLHTLASEAGEHAKGTILQSSERWNAEELMSLERARKTAREWEDAYEELQYISLSSLAEECLREPAKRRRAQRLRQAQQAAADEEDEHPISLQRAQHVITMVAADVSHCKELGLHRLLDGLLVESALAVFYSGQQPPYGAQTTLKRAKIRSASAQNVAEALLEAEIVCTKPAELGQADNQQSIDGAHKILNTALNAELEIAREKGFEAAALAGMQVPADGESTKRSDRKGDSCEALRSLGSHSTSKYKQRRIEPARGTITEFHAHAQALARMEGEGVRRGLATADTLAAKALDAMADSAIEALKAAEDVPAQQAEALSEVLVALCDARGLPSGALQQSRRLGSLRELGKLYEMPLREITSRCEAGELREHFSEEEVEQVVRSVFEETPLRVGCIERIRRLSGGGEGAPEM